MEGAKRVKFQWNTGEVTYMNEAVADIYEKRKRGKIIIEKKSVVVNEKDKKGNK